MIEEEILISNKAGLHARAAALLVQVANKYPCEVLLRKGSQEVNAKSIMGVMMLAATQGTQLTLVVEGEGAGECAASIKSLVDDKFGEGE